MRSPTHLVMPRITGDTVKRYVYPDDLASTAAPLISLRTLVLTACVTSWTEVANAQTPPGPGSTNQEPPQQTRELQPPGEVVVVTASRREEQLINAPATMTVITAEAIRNAPSQDITDLLRLVPGINVVQTSARDVNVTSRTAAGTLTNSLLVLLDGRSFYQDFFGNILWDFLPIDPEEIKQIEVIRGPASAVWGANALTGVVNVITKTPRELEGNVCLNAVRSRRPDTHRRTFRQRWSVFGECHPRPCA